MGYNIDKCLRGVNILDTGILYFLKAHLDEKHFKKKIKSH